jgi:hypothetical protein
LSRRSQPAQALDDEVVHCRDNFGVEVDAIVKLRDGRWGACVISLGEGHVEAAASLLLFPGQLTWNALALQPSWRCCAARAYGYQRLDGFAVWRQTQCGLTTGARSAKGHGSLQAAELADQ